MTEAASGGHGAAQAATAGSFFVAGLVFTSYVTFSTELSRVAELSSSQVGLLMSAFSFAYGAVQMVAGALTSRIRSRDILLLALAIMGLSSLLFALLTQYYWLVVLRIFMGIGAALVVPTSTHILSQRLAGPKLDRALGIFASGWGLGTLFAFYVLTLILPVGGYPWVMVGVAVVAALAALPVILFVPREQGWRPEGSLELGNPWLSKKLNWLPMIGLATAASYMAIITWAPVYLESRLATTSLQANLMTGLAGFSMVAGAFLGGWLAAALGKLPVVLSTTALSFLLLLALPALTSELLIATVVVLVGWIGFASFPAVMATIPRLVPSHQVGAASGYVNGLGFGAALVAPFVVGFALDMTKSFTIAFVAVAPLTLLGIFSVLALRKELGWRGYVIMAAAS